MNQEIQAWQPLTLGGIARFAQATLGRALLVALVAGVLASTGVTWFFIRSCNPVIVASLQQLPANAVIRNGRLEWPGPIPGVLGKTPFFAILVDTSEQRPPGHIADVQLELYQQGLKLRSLFGYVWVNYPPGWLIVFERMQLEPWWGAWQPFILAAIWLVGIGFFMVLWSAMAGIYCVPARIFSWLARRELSWIGAWRISLAALLPGALFMLTAIVFYGLRQIDLAPFLLLVGLHFLVGWLYLFGAIFYLPRLAVNPPRGKNPFTPDLPEEPKSGPNPFRTPPPKPTSPDDPGPKNF